MKLSQLFVHWNQVHADTLAILEKFTDDELTHRAYPGGMPVGRIALHIADAEEGWFRLIATAEREDWPSDYTLEHYPDKTAIRKLLMDTHTRTMAYLDDLELADLDRVFESPWGNFSLRFIIWHIFIAWSASGIGFTGQQKMLKPFWTSKSIQPG